MPAGPTPKERFPVSSSTTMRSRKPPGVFTNWRIGMASKSSLAASSVKPAGTLVALIARASPSTSEKNDFRSKENAAPVLRVPAAVVKADAYGLGSERVVRTLAEAGCRDFFVAVITEALALVRHAPGHRIGS